MKNKYVVSSFIASLISGILLTLQLLKEDIYNVVKDTYSFEYFNNVYESINFSILSLIIIFVLLFASTRYLKEYKTIKENLILGLKSLVISFTGVVISILVIFGMLYITYPNSFYLLINESLFILFFDLIIPFIAFIIPLASYLFKKYNYIIFNNLFLVILIIVCIFLYIFINKSNIVLSIFSCLLLIIIPELSYNVLKIILYSFKSKSSTVYLMEKFNDSKLHFMFTSIFIHMLLNTNYLITNFKNDINNNFISVIIFILILISLFIIYFIYKNDFIESNKPITDNMRSLKISFNAILRITSYTLLSIFFTSTIIAILLIFIIYSTKDSIDLYFINIDFVNFLIYSIIYILVFGVIITIDINFLNNLIIRRNENEK